MRPHRRFIMPRVAARMVANAPRRLASSTASQSSSLSRSRMLSRVRPALFTRMSIAPNAFSTRSTSAVTCATSATSQAESLRAAADLRGDGIGRATGRVRRWRRARRTRRASRAIARPMPRVLPVTRATRPVRSIFIMPPWRGVIRRRPAVPHGTHSATGGDLLHQARQHVARPHLHEERVRVIARRAARRAAIQRTGAVSCSSSSRARVRRRR